MGTPDFIVDKSIGTGQTKALGRQGRTFYIGDEIPHSLKDFQFVMKVQETYETLLGLVLDGRLTALT